MTRIIPLRFAYILALIAIALPVLVSTPSLATSGPGCFRIVGVTDNDVLNVRIAPNAKAGLAGTMDPKRHGIIALLMNSCMPASGPKNKQWCKITHYVDTSTTIGWVSRRFLKDNDCP